MPRYHRYYSTLRSLSHNLHPSFTLKTRRTFVLVLHVLKNLKREIPHCQCAAVQPTTSVKRVVGLRIHQLCLRSSWSSDCASSLVTEKYFRTSSAFRTQPCLYYSRILSSRGSIQLAIYHGFDNPPRSLSRDDVWCENLHMFGRNRISEVLTLREQAVLATTVTSLYSRIKGACTKSVCSNGSLILMVISAY